MLFRYFPNYLRDGYRQMITDTRKLIDSISVVRKCEFSDIVLDGGNVVRYADKAFVTDRVYRENPKIGKAELREKLRKLLGEEPRREAVGVGPRRGYFSRRAF